MKAFSAVSAAKQNGGNVTYLVARLNLALNLTQEATAQNATNPSGASALLVNASSIAEQVSSLAVTFGASGASARQALTEESLGGAIATILIASLVYLYGGRIYRFFWFYAYRHYTVRRGQGASQSNG
jgi:hypothetical protein